MITIAPGGSRKTDSAVGGSCQMSWVVPRCWTSGRSRFDANLESQTDLGTRQAARAICNWNFASSCVEHCGWTRSCCSVCDRATCMPSFVCRQLFFWGFCPLWTKDKQTRAPCQQLSKPPILPWLLLSCASGSVVTSLFTPHQGRTIISRRKALYPSVGAHGQWSRPSSGLYVEFK